MPRERPRRRSDNRPAPAGRRRPSPWPALAAAALACVVYANAVDNPFVYDDRDTVVANPSLADPSNVRFLLVYTPFRPVLNLSYALDRFLWGSKPRGFHLTNIGLHAILVALLYFFLLQVLDDEAGRTGGAEGVERARAAPAAAFAGASIFAVHPLLTESVGYVSGRSEVLCGVWFVGCALLVRAAIVGRAPVKGALAAVCGGLWRSRRKRPRSPSPWC